ncbi:protein TIFY 10b [Cryptomeria japonica]|uniref:protein TIFY 10b n=1 Tax=Cryptomeria japonica TaxID=3369 RepID=UPI0027DA8E56|nr:protein TIFY 10b [Cryptomeria japonica]
MSQPHFITIDFLGIGNDETAKENTSSAMDSQPQLMKRRAMQSCLRKIKPHMLQQVLSDCGVSEDLKTMQLFPQHAGGFQLDNKDYQLPLLDTKFSISEALNFKPPTKPSSSQLMLFYNGVLNVYGNISSDKAKVIMTMAASNGNTANLSNCEAFPKPLRESISKLQGSANQRHHLGIAHWKLPLAKKKSLGRFLQKRTAR